MLPEVLVFLCCGDALFDCFTGRVSKGELQVTAKAAGSPMNVAIGLARYGFETHYFTGISTDFLGQEIRNFLKGEGVGTDLCPPVDAPVTLGFVTLNEDGVPHYAFYGNGAADRVLTADDLPQEIPTSVKALHFGSYSTAVEPMGSTLLGLADRFSAGRISVYDPNIRPTVEPDMAVWRGVIDRFARRASLMKISTEDIGLVYGDAHVEALVADWQSNGVAIVVVTDGSNGAKAFMRNGSAEMPAVPCDVADTVGAGDAYHATLLAGLATFDRLDPEAIRTVDDVMIRKIMSVASHASSHVCARQGADMPRPEDLPEWFV